MIGLDSNILIRYIVQDDPQQSELVNNYLEKNVTAKSPGYINSIVLCEIVWVLKRAYGYKKEVIIEVIGKILQTRELIIENSELALLALKEYQRGQVDFCDYFIAVMNRNADCKFTVTLDQLAAKSKYFQLLTK